MVQAPVIALFPDRKSAERAAVKLSSVGFRDVKISTDTEFNPGLISANPKENQRTMERTYLGLVLGTVMGGIVGWIAGLALGKVFAAVGAAVAGVVGAVVGLLIGDFGTKTYTEAVDDGAVVLTVHFPDRLAVRNAVDILHEYGANEVSANRSDGVPPEVT